MHRKARKEIKDDFLRDEQVIAGKHPVLELLKDCPEKIERLFFADSNRSSYELRQALHLCHRNKVRYQFVPRRKLDKLTTAKHQGFLAKIFPIGFIEVEKLLAKAHNAPLPVLLALDQVQDPSNLGSLARTLYALGGAGLVILRNRCAPLGHGAFKSSAGALYKLPVARVTNFSVFLNYCAEKGITTCYAGLDKGCKDIFQPLDLEWPLCLVLGNEDKGVRPKVAKSCQVGVRIPMLGDFDSLNVSQAGAILLGEFLRYWLSSKAER